LAERRFTPERRLVSRGGRREADYEGRPVVLVVDDHVDSRDLMAAVLQEVGVAIAEAGTGADALERVAIDPRPSLILIDLSLPDCHGTEVVKTLKADPAARRIPVIALSASVMASDKEAAAEAGCAAFIEKPVLPDDVVAIVKRLLAAAWEGPPVSSSRFPVPGKGSSEELETGN
jgi:two-component system, cell cycle response regulator DivK